MLNQNLLNNFWGWFINTSSQSFFDPLINLASVVIVFLSICISFQVLRAAIEANEFKILPILIPFFKGKFNEDRHITIKNLGEYPAYGVEIDSFTIFIRDMQKMWKLEMKTHRTRVIPPKEEVSLALKGTENGIESSIRDLLLFHLDPEEEHERKPVQLDITFRNIKGHKYLTRFKTGKSGLDVKYTVKVTPYNVLLLKLPLLCEYFLYLYYGIKWKYIKPHLEGNKAK